MLTGMPTVSEKSAHTPNHLFRCAGRSGRVTLFFLYSPYAVHNAKNSEDKPTRRKDKFIKLDCEIKIKRLL